MWVGPRGIVYMKICQFPHAEWSDELEHDTVIKLWTAKS